MPRIKIRGYTSSELTTDNPLLETRELVYDMTNQKFKVGPGNWNSLSFVTAGLESNTFSGEQNLQQNTLKNAKLTAYAEKVITPTIVNSGLVLDLSSGNIFRTTLSTNVTGISIQSPFPSGNAHSITLIFDYIDSGRSITWPSSVYWNGGSGYVPTLSSGVNRHAIFSLMTTDGGSRYFGFVGGTNFGA